MPPLVVHALTHAISLFRRLGDVADAPLTAFAESAVRKIIGLSSILKRAGEFERHLLKRCAVSSKNENASSVTAGAWSS